MLRIALKVLLVIEVCALLVESTINKPLPRCRAYKVQHYEKGVSSCDTPSGRIALNDFSHLAILGHRRAHEKQYYWQCHGSLLNSRYVLIPGFCLTWGTSQFHIKVRLGAILSYYIGDSKPSDYDLENLIPHPNFKLGRVLNTIGLIKLSRKVEFSENVMPICLPESDISSSIMYQVNYESIKHNDPEGWPLTKYKMTVRSAEDCSAILWNNNFTILNGNTDDLFCLTRGTDECNDYIACGELGAPIYIDQQVPFLNTFTQVQVACTHVLLGIMPFEGVHESTFGIKVYPFLDWIDSVIWADGEDNV